MAITKQWPLFTESLLINSSIHSCLLGSHCLALGVCHTIHNVKEQHIKHGFTHHAMIVQKLQPLTMQNRMAYYQWIQKCFALNFNILDTTWWSDEDQFPLLGYITPRICVLAVANPHIICEKSYHPQRVGGGRGWSVHVCWMRERVWSGRGWRGRCVHVGHMPTQMAPFPSTQSSVPYVCLNIFHEFFISKMTGS